MAYQLQTRLEELAAERGRLREAIDRFGEALGATHDSDQLLRVLVETAVEATGAAGGVVVGAERRARHGRRRRTRARTGSSSRCSAGQVSFGSLMLFGDDVLRTRTG